MGLRSFLVGIAASLLVGCVSAPPPLPTGQPLAAYLDSVPDLSGTFIVGEGDKLVFRKSYGLADDAEARPIGDGDIWRWASITKQIVAVLVMQEVERGAFTLESSIADLLPDMAYDYASDVTVKMLLQHTSGLPDPDNLGPLDYANFDADTYCSGTPLSKPGETFEYNNCDYYILGKILENSTGLSWEALLDQRILEPLDMAETAVANDADLPETVTGYASAGVLAQAIDTSLYDAAGAIIGNPRDLLKFNYALMNGDLLSGESTDVLWQGDPSIGFVALGAWSFTAPLEGCSAPVQIIERRGHIAGIYSRNFILPEYDKSVVMFVNRSDFNYGEIWMGEGFAYDVLARSVC